MNQPTTTAHRSESPATLPAANLTTAELMQQVWQAPDLEAYRVAAGNLIANQQGQPLAQTQYTAALSFRVQALIMGGVTDTMELLKGLGISEESARRFIRPDSSRDNFIEVGLHESAGVSRDANFTGVIRFLADQIVKRQLPGLA